MQTNPTIDGVSRDYVLRLTREAHSVMLGMVEHCLNIRACMGMDEGFKDFDTGEEHDFVKELRALLDAPAVERQEPMHEHEHDCCANCMRPRMEHCSENCPAPDTSVWHAWDYDFAPGAEAPPEVADLQSTIAQLQARVQELESGQGEPVGQVVEFGKGLKEVSWIKGRMPKLGEMLFTAPPAPVAVVLSELESAFEKWWEEDGQYCRSGGGSYEKTFAYRAYEACLDTTAALNTSK